MGFYNCENKIIEKKVKMTRIYPLVLIVLVLFSCSRDWNSPLENDEDLRHQPTILSITQDITGFRLQLDYSYSTAAVLEFLRKMEDGAYEPVDLHKISSSVFADTTLDLEFNHDLTYKLRVKKGEYSTNYSNELAYSYTSTILNTPSDFVATTIELQGVRLNWQDNSGKESSYVLEKNLNGAGYLEMATLPANTVTYIDNISGMPATPLSLIYRVKAISSSLSSAWQEQNVIYSGLGAPTNLTITNPSFYNFSIAWTRNSTIATGYEIERKKDSAAFTLLDTVGPAINTFSDYLTETGTYTYRVRAKKDDVYSSYTNTISQNVDSIVPSQGLVAYYPFNGNANDESGNGRNCITYGAVLSMDRFGYANTSYEFDGTDDYLSSSSTGLPTAERTTSLWFSVNSLSSSPASVLFGYGGLDAFSWTGASWWMYVNSSIIGVACHCDSPVTPYYTYGSSFLAEWQSLIAITSSLGTQLYLNGELVASNATFVNNTIVTNKSMTIGVCVGAYGDAPFTNPDVTYFHGKIDDLRIYNRALTEAEILALYHEGGWTGNSAKH